MENMKAVIYAKDVLEFVTVGVRFCAFLEQDAPVRPKDFIGTLSKLLPLLYLKAEMLPRVDETECSFPEEFVTEQDYEAVRSQVASLLGEKDAYLDLDIANLHYIQEPQVKNISEDLADVYQSVRNFVTTYKLELEQNMYDALAQVKEQFEMYWGQSLLNALRALHGARFSDDLSEEEPEETDFWE